MAAVAELAKLKRIISELDAALRIKPPRTAADRHAVKSEIEHCGQQLDELRNRL